MSNPILLTSNPIRLIPTSVPLLKLDDLPIAPYTPDLTDEEKQKLVASFVGKPVSQAGVQVGVIEAVDLSEDGTTIIGHIYYFPPEPTPDVIVNPEAET